MEGEAVCTSIRECQFGMVIFGRFISRPLVPGCEMRATVIGIYTRTRLSGKEGAKLRSKTASINA